MEPQPLLFGLPFCWQLCPRGMDVHRLWLGAGVHVPPLLLWLPFTEPWHRAAGLGNRSHGYEEARQDSEFVLFWPLVPRFLG